MVLINEDLGKSTIFVIGTTILIIKMVLERKITSNKVVYKIYVNMYIFSAL
jgi:hypothetical protein